MLHHCKEQDSPALALLQFLKLKSKPRTFQSPSIVENLGFSIVIYNFQTRL